MGLVVDLPQPCDAVVGVDLSGLQRGVAEELLDFTHVRSAVEQMGGEGVPQHVGASLALNPAPCQLFADHPVDDAARDAFSFLS